MLTSLQLAVRELRLWLTSIAALHRLVELTITVPPADMGHLGLLEAGNWWLPPLPRLPVSLTSLTLLDIDGPSESIARQVRSYVPCAPMQNG